MVSQSLPSEQVSDSLLVVGTKDTKKKHSLTKWRSDAGDALAIAGMIREANLYRACETDFLVDVCTFDVTHEPKTVLKTCHLRYCPSCEQRDQARRLQRYVQPIWDLVNFAPRGWNLRKFELTTPYALDDPKAPDLYKKAWDFFETALRSQVYDILLERKKLSKDEIRRKRADLKKHHIGALVSAEFGETGHKLHFHCVILSPFIPIAKLVETWQSVTQGVAKIAYIRAIDNKNVDDELKEVVKYVTKFSKLPASMIPALASVLKGVRRLRTYGVFQGIKPEEKEPCLCKTCSNRRRLVEKMVYVHQCAERGVALEDEIVKAAEERLIDLSERQS